MKESTIGRNIAALRKEKQITQETLANALNISVQAVSKWENNNGSPDSSTIPRIADFFGVSIDRLYGRRSYDQQGFQDYMLEYLMRFPPEERLAKAFDLQIYASVSFADIPKDVDLDYAEFLKHMNNICNKTTAYSQFMGEQGLSFGSLDPTLPFSLIMPEPPEGWATQLHFSESLSQFFHMLSNEHNLKAIFLLHSRPNKPFTTKLLEKELDISPNTALNIITDLTQYDMVQAKELEVDDEIMNFYELVPQMAIIPFMTFAKLCIHKARVFFFQYFDRNDQPYITRKEQQQ